MNRRRRGPADEPAPAPRRATPALALLAVMAVLAVLAAVANTGGGGGGGTATDDTGTAPDARVRPPVDPDGPPITVSAVGDIMMGTPQFGLPPDDGASFFSQVTDLLTGDVVLGNLEGTLSTTSGGKCDADEDDCFAFQSPPAYAAHLASAGFNVMNLANNHANDFGAAGLEETRRALAGAGVQTTGLTGTMATVDSAGRVVAVLGFAPYEWADPLLDLDAAAERVRNTAPHADIIIVTFHGGAEGAEYSGVPTGPEEYLGESRGDARAFARAVIDAGADLVVGHGPHVLRGMEVYGGRLIAYSLGNFAGYRAFSLDGPLSESMVLSVELAPDGSLRSGRIHPTELVGEGTPAPGGDAVATVTRLSRSDFAGSAPRIGAKGVIRPPG